jgi:hypothetical protein
MAVADITAEAVEEALRTDAVGFQGRVTCDVGNDRCL